MESLLQISIAKLYNYLSSHPVGQPGRTLLPPQTALACSMVMAFDGIYLQPPPGEKSNCPPAEYPARQPPGTGSFAGRVFDTAVFRNALAASSSASKAAAADSAGSSGAGKGKTQQKHNNKQQSGDGGSGSSIKGRNPRTASNSNVARRARAASSESNGGGGGSSEDGGAFVRGSKIAEKGTVAAAAAPELNQGITLAAIEALAQSPGIGNAASSQSQAVAATIGAGFGSFHALATAFAVREGSSSKWESAAAAAATVRAVILRKRSEGHQKSAGGGKKEKIVGSTWSAMPELTAAWTELSSAEEAPTDFDAARNGLGTLLSLRPAPIAELSSAIEAALAGMSRSSTSGSSSSSSPASPTASSKALSSAQTAACAVVVLELVALLRSDVDAGGKGSAADRLVAAAARAVANMPLEAKVLAAKWLSLRPAEVLTEMAGSMQMMLTQQVKLYNGLHGASLHTVQVLQVLHDANEASALRPGLSGATRSVELDVFYSSALTDKLDFKNEYQIWKKKNDQQQQQQQQQQPTKATQQHTPSNGGGSTMDDTASPLEFGFLFGPACKARVLRIDAVVQMSQKFQDACVNQAWVLQAQKMMSESSDVKPVLREAINPYLMLEVRREHLIEDTLAQISLKLKDLKKPLKVKYVGGGEQGLDLGGVQKEFFQLIMELIMDQQHAMFGELEDKRTLWINGASLESDREFEMVGILIGLAIYNGVILNVHFPMTLYKKLLGESLSLVDLKETFPTLGKSLQQMLDFEGDVDDVFCQTFQINERMYDEVVDIDLIENGSDVDVTNENRERFVELYVNHKLNAAVEKQFKAFSRGFHLVCGGSALTLFRPEELEMLVCGSLELDVSELQESCSYANGLTPDTPVVQWLWKLLYTLSTDNLKRFLNFVTGSDRVPIKGLGELSIVIQLNEGDSTRLPTALTCFSRLLLPEYESEEILRERMLLAMEHGKGFGLA